MLMCLDVGNSQIYGGIFDGDEIKLQFRRTSKTGASSDEMGIFLRTVLRENGVDPDDIHEVAVCSVVPEVDHSLRNCCRKYFERAPFMIQPGVKTGLKIKYYNPVEVGADRIANSVAATHIYPDRDLIIIDFGTATTFCAINAQKEYLGGTITAGVRISMDALVSNTAKLPSVAIVKTEKALGRATVESIQSGLFYGAMGAAREITARLTEECFGGKRPLVIGTGGLASLFTENQVFDIEVPDLVLKGLYLAQKMNQ
jgi:type III pantothenate kinase